MSIDDLRRAIDDIDKRIVELLNERAGCALAVGRLKNDAGLEIYQPDRERDVLEHVREINHGPLDDGAVTRLFERIIDENRRLERIVHEGIGSQESGIGNREPGVRSRESGNRESGVANEETADGAAPDGSIEAWRRSK